MNEAKLEKQKKNLVEAGLMTQEETITELAKCSQGLFPMGIAITHKDAETGESVTDKISLTKREKWIEFLAGKAGVSMP